MDMSKRALCLTLLGILAYNLVVSLDSTALSVILPTVGSALHASVVETYWTGTSFVIASAATQPLFGPLSNAFGRKPLVLAALVIFIAGTIVCGTSQNIAALIAGRTVQGVGCGGLTAMTYVLLADLFTLRERAKGIALISLVWLFGVSLGPVTGGGFTQSVTWRWTFWICLPFAGISIVLVGLFLMTSHKRPDLENAVKQVDWIGSTLFVGSLISFLVAISWGGSQFPWDSYHTLVPLCLGVAGVAASVIYEVYVPASPILPKAVCSNRTSLFSYIGMLMVGLVQFGLLFYLPLYYQICKGYTPLISGVALIINCALAGLATGASGTFITKTGRYMPMIWIGWPVLALGVGLELLLKPSTSVATWFFINVPSGIGLGFLFASLPVASQAAAPEAHKAIAAGLSPFFRTIGQAIGIVLGNTIYQNVLKKKLSRAPFDFSMQQADLLATNTTQLQSTIADLALGSPKRKELQNALNQSLHTVWWALLAFALAGIFTGLAMKQISLDRRVSEPEPESEKDSSSSQVGITQDSSGNSAYSESRDSKS